MELPEGRIYNISMMVLPFLLLNSHPSFEAGGRIGEVHHRKGGDGEVSDDEEFVRNVHVRPHGKVEAGDQQTSHQHYNHRHGDLVHVLGSRVQMLEKVEGAFSNVVKIYAIEDCVHLIEMFKILQWFIAWCV